ncbi:MAG: nitrilase family protein [Saprospiraceae bacterium]|nr:nitrilase family protein [Saprospiraceae bacterium]
MAKSPLTVNLVQFDIAWEQPSKNLLKLEDLLSQSDAEAEITLLPEMFTTGFTMNAKAMAESMDGPSITWMQDTSRRLETDLVGSLIIEDEGRYFNRLIWMGPEGLRGTYDKRHLFTMAGEDKVYTAGTERLMVQKKGWNCFPFICYDLRFPVWSRLGKKADLLIYIANFPEKRVNAWSQLLIARAIENQTYVIGLNRIGWGGEQHYYSGDSVVIDPLGNTMLDLQDNEAVESIQLDGVSLEIIRKDMPFLDDADRFEIQL